MRARTDRHRPKLASAALAAALLLAAAGCSGGPSDADSRHQSKVATSETTGETPRPVQADVPAPDGVAFTDPEGRYTLTVPADWEARHGMVGEGIEIWLVAEADAAFAPNVNAMTEAVTGMSLQDYLDLSIANAPSIISDFELLSSNLVTGPAGQELAVMESSGMGLMYLAVIGMGPDGAAILTFTSTPDRFAAIRDAVYPYLLTLQPT